MNRFQRKFSVTTIPDGEEPEKMTQKKLCMKLLKEMVLTTLATPKSIFHRHRTLTKGFLLMVVLIFTYKLLSLSSVSYTFLPIPSSYFYDRRYIANVPCKFLPSKAKSPFNLRQNAGPTPVMLISLGRSGSSVTWDTISRLTGAPTTIYELTGGNRTKSENFFNKWIPSEIGVKWATTALCQIQHIHKHAQVAGFQWKPYMATFNHPYAKAALLDIATYQKYSNNNPPVKVIYLTRNRLDVTISNIKHRGHVGDSENAKAHCEATDLECIKNHHELGSGVYIPLGTLSLVKNYLNFENKVHAELQSAGVDYLHVTYDGLYSSSNATEWKKIFRYLGKGPGDELTLKMVQKSFSMAKTSKDSHKEIISNFEDVQKFLNEAGIGFLLH